MARKHRNEDFLLIKRAFAAEPAADIRRDDPELIARDVQNSGEEIADDAGNLGGGGEGQGAPSAVEFGHIAAVLHGGRGLAMEPETAAHVNGRAQKLEIGIAALEFAFEKNVGARLF